MDMNVGDRLEFCGYTGTVVDWKNPPYGKPITPLAGGWGLKGFERGEDFLVYFDDERSLYRNSGYKPYYILSKNTSGIIILKPELHTKTFKNKHHCPLCSSDGLDMAVKFYCSNKSCYNFHK
jgi:hypothetical protein